MAKPILLYTSIWEEQAENITNQILEAPEDEPIEIWMNTPGGSVTSGWTIMAAINEKKQGVNFTVLGDASSMGAIMLLFGKYNKAYDISNFLFHRAASFWEDLMTEEELKDIENRNKIIRKKMSARIDEALFTEVTGKTFDDMFNMDDRLDIRLTAQQAKKIGLIDEIVKLDPRKKAEIESRFIQDLAAISYPEKVITNKNVNIMGKLSDLIFGEKDSLLVGVIGESQFIYTKLEKGAKIKGIGKDAKPISGTFEAENKSITVVENEITSIAEVNKDKAEIEALKAEIKALKESQITVEDIAEVLVKMQEKQDAEIAALKADFAKAKITVSQPKLPLGEFKDDKVAPINKTAYEIKQEIEARAAERQALRDKEIKGGV
jgi:ATP-dependent Clp protease protease subunit